MRRRAALTACVAAWLAGASLACRGRDEGRVVVAYPAAVATLDAHASSDEFTLLVLRNVFESLVSFDSGGGLRPQLAESWHTPDDTTWVFQLRPGVRLHDGRVLTPEDVARCLERARSAPASRRQGELVAVRSVEAQGPRTLVIRTHRPFSALPNRLASVALWAEPLAGGDSPAGTGPYRVREWRPPETTILEAFPGHRDGAPPVRVLEFRAVLDPKQRLALLQRGEVQLLVDVSAADLRALAASPGIRTATRRGLRVVYLAMDCQREPFSNVRVRRALALAVDRERIVRGPLEGQAEVADQIVAPEVFGAAPSLFTRPHDSAGAKRLLAEAGRASGFSVTLDYPVGKYRAIDAVVEALVGDLGRVGIRARPRPLESGAFFASMEANRLPLYLMGWMATSGDASISYEQLLHTPRAGFGQQNGGHYSNPEVDRLLEEAATRAAPEERRPLLYRVASLVQLDAPVIPLYRQADLYAYSADLEFEPRDDRAIDGAALRWRKER
jgi:peptide/nickel transport system substrate-binding protein